jgi:archaemetzincin
LNGLENISLISFGYFEKDFLEKIAGAIRQEFHREVIVTESHIDLPVYYDPGRRQYNGMKLLQEVDSMHNPDHLRTLGLFNVDLFIPILTYIFGQAYLHGRSGITSTYRLRNELYGMKKDDTLLSERFRKVCIHELGHTFGLIHCQTLTCVMRSSTYVEDLDQKDYRFCAGCREEIVKILS